MTRLLTKHVFTEDDLELPEVQGFHCGDERWDLDVSEWIKSASGDNSVIEDMKRFGMEVWLYRDDTGALVGYSSLGETRYTWPLRSKKKEVVSVVAFIGVQKQYQGEPKEALGTTNTPIRSSTTSWRMPPRRLWRERGIRWSCSPSMRGTLAPCGSTGTESFLI